MEAIFCSCMNVLTYLATNPEANIDGFTKL